jgi:hypothetical protein
VSYQIWSGLMEDGVLALFMILTASAALLVSPRLRHWLGRGPRHAQENDAARYWLHTAELEVSAREGGLSPETAEHLEQLKILGTRDQRAAASWLLARSAGSQERLLSTGEIPAVAAQHELDKAALLKGRRKIEIHIHLGDHDG